MDCEKGLLEGFYIPVEATISADRAHGDEICRCRCRMGSGMSEFDRVVTSSASGYPMLPSPLILHCGGFRFADNCTLFNYIHLNLFLHNIFFPVKIFRFYVDLHILIHQKHTPLNSSARLGTLSAHDTDFRYKLQLV